VCTRGRFLYTQFEFLAKTVPRGGHCVHTPRCLRSFGRFWLDFGRYLELEAHTGCKKSVWVRGIGCGCAGAGLEEIVVTKAIVKSKMDFTGPLWSPKWTSWSHCEVQKVTSRSKNEILGLCLEWDSSDRKGLIWPFPVKTVPRGGHCAHTRRCLRHFGRFLLDFSRYLELEAHTGCKRSVWVRGIGCGCAGAGLGKTVATRAVLKSKIDFTGPLWSPKWTSRGQCEVQKVTSRSKNDILGLCLEWDSRDRKGLIWPFPASFSNPGAQKGTIKLMPKYWQNAIYQPGKLMPKYWHNAIPARKANA
jgi:hypothetical protein